MLRPSPSWVYVHLNWLHLYLFFLSPSLNSSSTYGGTYIWSLPLFTSQYVCFLLTQELIIVLTHHNSCSCCTTDAHQNGVILPIGLTSHDWELNGATLGSSNDHIANAIRILVLLCVNLPSLSFLFNYEIDITITMVQGASSLEFWYPTLRLVVLLFHPHSVLFDRIDPGRQFIAPFLLDSSGTTTTT